MSTAPTSIADQIEDAAEYFAIALKNSEAGAAVEIPEWLSLRAQSWIESNAAVFGDMILSAHKRLRQDIDKRASRPTFVLPDPERTVGPAGQMTAAA